MSAHFLLHVIPLHFLFITLFIFFSLRTKLHFGQSWVQSSPPALLPALKKGDVGRLHVEISMVYLVYSTLSSLANQNIGLSAEVSLIYSEYNDGLQNYSFKFLSFCFDFWPLAGFWLKHCAEFISEMLRLLPFVWWKHSRYETEQEADFFLGSSVDNSQMWPLQDKVHGGGRGELRTVLKGNMSGWCRPPPVSWYVFFLSQAQISPLVISHIGRQKDKFTWTLWAAVWQAHVGDVLI